MRTSFRHCHFFLHHRSVFRRSNLRKCPINLFSLSYELLSVGKLSVWTTSQPVSLNPLTRIINASLSQAKIPADWKAAKVIPVYKAGKVNQIGNYRPISILPVISKLIERVVQVQVVKHLREHNILNPFQFGFRKGHSTETASISLTDTIRRNMDQGLLTGAVFVDLSKAFDTIDHTLT